MARYMAIRIAAAPLMVSDTVMASRSMPSKAISKSRSVSTAMPTRPTSPIAFGRVGIVAALRRQIERDVQAGLAVGDQIFEALVGVGRVGEAGVLPHGPRPMAIHQRVDAAGERRLARPALIEAAARHHVLGCVERLDLDAALVDDAAHGACLRAACLSVDRCSFHVLPNEGHDFVGAAAGRKNAAISELLSDHAVVLRNVAADDPQLVVQTLLMHQSRTAGTAAGASPTGSTGR